MARYLDEPPLLLTSRQTVDGLRSNWRAIARMLSPLASPRVIVSRSRIVKELSELEPRCGLISPWYCKYEK